MEVSGRVLSASGVPVPYADVEVEIAPARGFKRDRDGRFVAPSLPVEARADSQGRFHARLGSAVRDVQVVARSGALSSAPHVVRVIRTASRKRHEVDVRLRARPKPAPRAVTLRDRSGTPLAGARAYVDPQELERHHAAASVDGLLRGEGPLVADANGAIALDADTPDDAIVAITLPGDGLREIVATVRAGDLGDSWRLTEDAAPRPRRAVVTGLHPEAEVYVDGGPLAEPTLDDWRSLLDLNLTASFLTVREAVRHFLRDGGGRVIGIASRQGADRAPAQQAAYGASKAGLIRLLEATAAEYAGNDIQAVAVAPSMILFGGEDADGVRADDLAAMCAYLCADAGAAHNGATLRMYGTA